MLALTARVNRHLNAENRKISWPKQHNFNISISIDRPSPRCAHSNSSQRHNQWRRKWGGGGGGCGGWSPPKTLGTGAAPPELMAESVFSRIVATTAVREYIRPHMVVLEASARGDLALIKARSFLALSPCLCLRETMRLARAVSAHVCGLHCSAALLV